LKSLRVLLAVVLFILACDCFAAGRPSKTVQDKLSNKPLPTFDAVTKQVQQLLANDPEYQAGDLITTSKAERIFLKLEQSNWRVADRREIIKLMVSDSDWLAHQFSSLAGRQFMREISAMPGGYDRVDRLRRMPYGETQISDFIQTPDGSKMIEYMTTTQEGKNLGEQLSEGVDGRGFNKATGRIYTELQLLKRLKRSYDAEATRRIAIDPKTVSAPSDKAAEGTPPPPVDVPSKSKRAKRTRSKPAPAASTATAPKPAVDTPDRPSDNDPFDRLLGR
jgi:hypothetical protein